MENVRQNIQADNGGVAFSQGTGRQHNEVTQHFYGPGSVAASDAESCFRYGKLKFESQEYGEAEFPLVTAAEAGRVEAMELLYLLYEVTGRGEKAREWVERLAELGEPDACREMGRDVELKIAFTRTQTRRYVPLVELVDEALGWYRKGYDAGHDVMAENIGKLLYKECRYDEAIPYLEEAIAVNEREDEEEDSDVLKRCLKDARKSLERERKKLVQQQDGDKRRRWWRSSSSG
ncbi:hypothetical protein [Streptomyces sp. PSAA01]|uniref:hypothetical protein n=1 Tax=Streptomyces sp. PSAA01 TaxID=2912762 RepID=UPI001F37D147|nr:hypothetical protein [Streptomyces sp. PSAA01]MCG0286108.1 hypothetical protein [Streptomyces sp. PSAA01]